jgi:hypothetical protein
MMLGGSEFCASWLSPLAPAGQINLIVNDYGWFKWGCEPKNVASVRGRAVMFSQASAAAPVRLGGSP